MCLNIIYSPNSNFVNVIIYYSVDINTILLLLIIIYEIN
ncbi:hypothetical protein SEETMRM10607_5580 [Salmonella enterica subsp. enterica serovar Typhimurium]|nr:hypothetical protein DC51_0949 [Salmonella enterica subsp. enterica serovar Typhimurium]AQU51544.1 hypothetical protein SEETMRM10607_5580 [Salmonella enterica subsp. enterica serovar Typhimurium]EFX48734.1 hypothetical protein SEE_02111 [Salmonella enterica subsp. enterica serovar Typhimurium str. TN061786]CDF53186.1 hypothetical protein BN855_10100 [Salmonella enterica subsp. enterica serovar Bovismorbificans str. 3114]